MSGVAQALFPDLDGYWFAAHRADPRGFALYRRHYSAQKNAPGRHPTPNFMGPGQTLVLLTVAVDAVFAWQRNVGAPRRDGQQGVCCTLFRNEGPLLSSALIREADELADRRWPGERHFTYVDPLATVRRRSRAAAPGHCFLMAGWRATGQQSRRGLIVLERPPLVGGAAQLALRTRRQNADNAL